MEGEKGLCVAIFKEIAGRDLPADISKGEEYTKSIQYLCNIKPVKSLLRSVYSQVSRPSLVIGD